MNVETTMQDLGRRAREAAHALSALRAEDKNRVLAAMAQAILDGRGPLREANRRDVDAAREAGLSEAMVDRLVLTDARIDAMAAGLRDVAALPDPVGEELRAWTRPNGLRIRKVRVPIGVIGIIYESRPNVTADAAGLCFKAGNAVILRGGKEAAASNRAIADALAEGGASAGMPSGAIQLVPTADRDAVRILVQMTEYVDLIIPRGGEGLIRAVAEQAHVPVIKHYKGVCHTYVDASADLDMALAICVNAKVQRPGVCNAMETLLVHQDAAETFLPACAARLQELGVDLRGDDHARRLVPSMSPATEQDWYEEYLDLTLAVRVVPHVAAAIAHINQYGSQHSDAIVANDPAAQDAFSLGVDSSTVYVNASTRFTDGAEFGMGAEIGISTDKLHARGPMGLEELTTYKYLILGNGQIRP